MGGGKNPQCGGFVWSLGGGRAVYPVSTRSIDSISPGSGGLVEDCLPASVFPKSVKWSACQHQLLDVLPFRGREDEKAAN